MALLAMYCIWRLGKDARTIYRPLILPVGCALTLIIIQVVIHDQSPNAAINRQYLNWIILLIVIQSLLLRNDFLHRFGIAATTLGLTLLPYLVFNYGNAAATSVQRVGLSVGFANPDELGAWFGFCVPLFHRGGHRDQTEYRSYSVVDCCSRASFYSWFDCNAYRLGSTCDCGDNSRSAHPQTRVLARVIVSGSNLCNICFWIL